MPSVNDDLDYNNFFPGISEQGDSTKKKIANREKKNKHKTKKSITHRHPLNVRIDGDLRKEFVAACKKAKMSQHVPLEKALRRILKSMEKDSKTK